MKTKKYIKPETKIAIVIIVAIIVIVGLTMIMAKDMEKHIEKVSKECASEGYGIKAKYTKDGDKYYVCDR